MEPSDGTVFVLGAGFTRAFLPSAPLLVDRYGADELKRRFKSFPEAKSLIELEQKSPDHPPDVINLERLMTRLVGGMPYDQPAASQNLASLLTELKQAFLAQLANARREATSNPGELRLFANWCINYKCHCITFNYDDLLDEALWRLYSTFDLKISWSPDWGYGFPCRMSEACVRATEAGLRKVGSMLLLKMHGSVNWRIPLGQSMPYVVEAIRHHEPWFEHWGYGHEKIELEDLESYLEREPLLVPPVLSKVELNEQPILRLIWSHAIDALKKSSRVVFLGYSLPITDIAAGFLFREGLAHLRPDEITVVDFASGDDDRERKLARLLPAYRAVFPSLAQDQFHFCGAANWIGDNLVSWLYDSHGKPVAFEATGWYVSRTGEVIGSRCRKVEVWMAGKYRGEIVNGNRLLMRKVPPSENAGGDAEPPLLPSVPRLPTAIARISMPEGFQNLKLRMES